MMAARPISHDRPDGLVRLAASAPLRGDPDRLAASIAAGRLAWLGEELAVGENGMRRFAVDLRLRVGGETAGLTTFRKAAYLDLGRPRRTEHGWEVEVGWRAASAAPLFPVFWGLLEIDSGGLRIDGLYSPPGGAVGRVADRVLLHIAANGTARWLLAELAAGATVDAD
jgi:hypothetical protein